MKKKVNDQLWLTKCFLKKQSCYDANSRTIAMALFVLFLLLWVLNSCIYGSCYCNIKMVRVSS